jgi:hypothetical protein
MNFPQLFSTESVENLVEILPQHLQSCYKQTLRTFCTSQRRRKKSFHYNTLTLTAGSHLDHLRRVSIRDIDHKSIALHFVVAR